MELFRWKVKFFWTSIEPQEIEVLAPNKNEAISKAITDLADRYENFVYSGLKINVVKI